MGAGGRFNEQRVRAKIIMKAEKSIAINHRMRSQPLWRLLASDNGSTVIGLLQSLLYEKERSLPASSLFERLTRNLEELRFHGNDFSKTAQAYVANWLGYGYLERLGAGGWRPGPA